MRKYYLLLLFLFSCFSGCMTAGPLFNNEYNKKNKIPIKKYKLLLNDNRKVINKNKIDLPFFTTPKDNFSINPSIDSNIDVKFKSILNQYTVIGNIDTIFKIEILKGLIEFRVRKLNFELYINVELKLSIMNAENNKLLDSQIGHSWGCRIRMWEDEVKMHDLFHEAINKALINALNKIKTNEK